MELRRVFAAGACLVLFACSSAPPVVQEETALQSELEPPKRDLDFEAAQGQLQAGPVDRYVPLKWINIARDALDSESNPDDIRGDFPRALRWAGLAARAVLERPYSDLVYEVLTEHVRVCNHTASPCGEESLARLRQFDKLHAIQKVYLDVLELQGQLLKTQLADGTYSPRYWSYAAPELAQRLQDVGKQVDLLLAPNESNKPLQFAWLKLHVAWATITTRLAVGRALANQRSALPDWQQNFPRLDKEVLRTIWFISSEAHPRIVSILHLSLQHFYAAAGDKEKAQQNLKTAKVRVLPTHDGQALLRVDLAEADLVLAPESYVETLGINVHGPAAGAGVAEPPPAIRPPVPESVWLARSSEVESILFTAESRYRDAHNLRGLAATWLRRGYLSTALGRYDEAAEFYRQSESVASLAGDTRAIIIALAHTIALNLKSGQTGRAQQAANRFFATVDATGFKALALSMADALVGMAAREFSRFGSPNQRLATFRLVSDIYRRYAPEPLRVLVVTRLVRLAAHYKYIEVVRSFAANGVALAKELTAGRVAPDALPAVQRARCTIVSTAAAALAMRDDCDRGCLSLAEDALQCVTASGQDAEAMRLTVALARAANGRAEDARKLLDADDLLSQLQVAQKAGETARVVDLSRRFVADSRAALAEVTPPPPEPVADAVPSDDPLAEEELPPPPPDSAEVKAARANLAVDIMRLAQALSDYGLERLRGGAKAPLAEFDEARRLLDEWRELTVDSGEWSERPWELLGLYGQVAAQQGEKLAAWMSFSGALDSLWQARDGIRSLSGRAAFSNKVSAILRDAQRFLLLYPEESFDVPRHGSLSGAEAALAIHLDLSAYALVGRLAGGTPFQGKLIEGPDGTSLEALEARLRKAREEEEYNLVYGSSQDVERTRKERETVEAWLEQSRLDLAHKYPRLALSLGAPNPPSIDALKQLAAKRNVTFVVYGLSHPQSVVWAVSGSGVKAAAIPASGREIIELEERIRAVLDQGKEPAASVTRLSSWLLAPVAQHLPAGGTLAIVPDGPLHAFPFGILGPEGQPLLASHPLFMVPSVTLYQALVVEDHGPHSQAGLLLMLDPSGQPAYSADDEESRKSRQVMPTLGTKLAAWFGEDMLPAVYAGSKATETAFYGACRGRDLLHLTGTLEPFVTEPMYSGLMLANQGVGDEDGLLQAWELAGTTLSARSALLHVVRSDAGTWSEAQATAGVSRGFFAAGIPSVLVNTVATDNEAANAFFDAYYRALLKGARACDAAREASLVLRDSPDFKRASAWGAFVVSGLGDAVVYKAPSD